MTSVSERTIQLALSLTSFPCIVSDLEPLLMIILTLLLSVVKGALPGLALDIQKFEQKP